MRLRFALVIGALIIGAVFVPASAQAVSGPTVGANTMADLDHGLQFPQNKQNEPAITRDPVTGVLVAGANDEISQPLCPGTSTPLASPCPFKPGAPTSGFYRSTDSGSTWTGGYLSGFASIGRTSGGDPTLDFGPRLCTNGAFSYGCGALIYYGALADPFPGTGGELGTANDTAPQGFRESGERTVASDGTVEVFWTENADSPKYPSLQVVTTSRDGGNTYAAPITIAQVTDYPLRGTPFDAVDLFNRVPGMSARVDCFPHPAADPTSNKVYVVWCDFTGGHGTVQAAVSGDGLSWTLLGTIGSVSGRNAFFPEPAVAGNGVVAVALYAPTPPPARNPGQTGVPTYDAHRAQRARGPWSAPVRGS